MYKLSKYIICLPISNGSAHWLIINGCSGGFAVVSHKIAQAIIAGQRDFSAILTLSVQELDMLREIGCLIPLDADEEKTVSGLCKKIHSHSSRQLDVTFIPSYVCNFHCPYCFERSISADRPQWLREQMSPALVDDIFLGLEKLTGEGKKIASFTLFGGEPLLPQNKQIIEKILECCRAYSAPVLVVTNGYYLNDYVALLKKYPIHTLKITIDGTKELHDRRRAPTGGESFDRIIGNVLTALENGIAVSLRTNINQENMDCIPKLEQYYSDIGLTDFPGFSYYFKATMACFEPKGNAVSDPEIMEILGNDCSHYCHNSAYNRIYKPLKRMLTGAAPACYKAEYCGAHSGNLVFDPTGKIFSCWDVLTDPRSVIGVVDRDRGVFHFNENYSVWQSRTVDSVAFCKDCKYKLFCGGGCAAQGLVANNDMNKPFCEAFIERFNQIAIKVAAQQLKAGKMKPM